MEWRIDTIVTATPTIEGRAIGEYLGVVAGEAILGAHIGREIKASLTDIFGGRSAEYEEEVRKARALALEEMSTEAQRLGATAVVGVDIDCEVIRDGMLMVSPAARRSSFAERALQPYAIIPTSSHTCRGLLLS